MCVSPTLAASLSNPERTDTREIKFPEDHALGPLLLVPMPASFATRDDRGQISQQLTKKSAQIVGPAQGTVKVVVPPNQMLFLELNRYAMEHPSSLSKVSEHGIDAVRACFIIMEDGQSATDRVLQYLPHFHDLLSLDVSASDLTDAGLESLRRCIKLKYINANCCLTVRGSCLRSLASLPNLTSLDLSGCPVDPACFRYLPQMPKLRFLAIDKTTAKQEEIKQIGQCHSLAVLRLSGCRELNDQSISFLSTLKNLDQLDIRQSQVSVAGLKKLSVLKLSRLGLPKPYYSQNELADLRKSFPKTELIKAPQKFTKAGLKNFPWHPLAVPVL